jgi:DNA-directed RNA polymerase specialized sigma24 family protein
VRPSREAEYTDYIRGRLPSLRRVAYLLCQDWQRADDLVQTAITRLYTHWGRARNTASIDAYARTILIRTFLAERRSAWSRRVTLRFYCDLPVDETAAELGCTPGTVKSQTAKGLSALRRALDPVPAEEK